jgi:DNA helicase II / ATP-dependent DNA helicase PcrA
MSEILKNLNQAQKNSVQYINGSSVIIAGAGTGKTRVITSKIAYLIQEIKINPEKILALTFTNKAVKEMRDRVQYLLKSEILTSTISTYHSLCAKILKEDINHLNFSNNFYIIDENEQKKIIKDLYLFLYKTKIEQQELKSLKEKITIWKRNNFSEKEIIDLYGNEEEWIKKAKIYQSYKEQQKLKKCLDFDDLLLLSFNLLKNYPLVLEKWQKKFDYILIDEFQDTSEIQYELVKLFSKEHKNISVVGDPNQTIYSWRGANINFILNFQNEIKNSKIFYLNQNYRSTKKILNLSNDLIEENKNKIKNYLFTENESGKEIIFFQAENSQNESKWVIKQIIKIKKEEKIDFSKIAIIYRNNFLSQEFEQELIKNNINYKIFGGFKFFERKEIKDILAYLKTIVYDDDIATERLLLSIPLIGIKKIEKWKINAQEEKLSLIEYCIQEFENWPILLKNKLEEFLNIINEFKQKLNNLTSVYNFTKEIIDETNYLKKLKENQEEERIENIYQFLDQLREFDNSHPEIKDSKLLINYLQEITLDLSNINDQDKKNFVNLMTIHSAKGLEFDIVFVVGLNEGILPNYRSYKNKDKLKEERRAFYVAMTRAKKRLFLSCSCDYSFLLNNFKKPSSFLDELKKENLIIESEFKDKIENFFWNEKSNDKIKLGKNIIHKLFGEGKIIKIINNKTIEVLFNNEKLDNIKIVNLHDCKIN